MILPFLNESDRPVAIAAALGYLSQGELIVLPTDTVYGVAADAFKADAVTRLLAAKGRDKQMPPPVLISSVAVVPGLARNVPEHVMDVMREFWPGALTVIVHAQPSLAWDLGETHGTVALRVPDHSGTIELLEKTGPLAVTSANLTGQPAATTAINAQEQLGEAVSLYLDAGTSQLGQASTILDATRPDQLRVVRAGEITQAQLEAITGPDVWFKDSPA